MKRPTDWNMKKINEWFQRSIDKERARFTNMPKPHTGGLSVPENFSNFAPPIVSFGKQDARRHR